MSLLENESPVQVGEIELFDFHAQVEETFTRWTLSLRMQVMLETKHKMGLVARKPVFGVSDKASFKPVSSATETS